MKVREMSPDERPREKAKREGLSALSNRELIALLLQSGTKSKSVLELADEVLSLCGSLGELRYMDPNDLMEINGIKVGSTYIRTLLLKGDMEQAAKFLGHPHCLSHTVEHG